MHRTLSSRICLSLAANCSLSLSASEGSAFVGSDCDEAFFSSVAGVSEYHLWACKEAIRDERSDEFAVNGAWTKELLDGNCVRVWLIARIAGPDFDSNLLANMMELIEEGRMNCTSNGNRSREK
jgi:hypothetical protein